MSLCDYNDYNWVYFLIFFNLIISGVDSKLQVHTTWKLFIANWQNSIKNLTDINGHIKMFNGYLVGVFLDDGWPTLTPPCSCYSQGNYSCVRARGVVQLERFKLREMQYLTGDDVSTTTLSLYS